MLFSLPGILALASWCQLNVTSQESVLAGPIAGDYSSYTPEAVQTPDDSAAARIPLTTSLCAPAQTK